MYAFAFLILVFLLADSEALEGKEIPPKDLICSMWVREDNNFMLN